MKNAYLSKITAAAALLLLAALPAAAQQPLTKQRTTMRSSTVCGLPVDQVELKRNGNTMSVSLDMQLSKYKLKGDRASVFAPVLVNGGDSVVLDPVGLYRRTRYIQYLRYGEHPLGGENETSYRYSKRPATVGYTQTVPYQAWMDGAELRMLRRDYGCCSRVLASKSEPVAEWRQESYAPVYHFVTPAAEAVKMRELSGRAYIDFQVNSVEIDPDYRNNPAELAKIVATIDSVRSDRDVTVNKLTIKGYASPESPYGNNERLAKGRTATLRRYVQRLYRFPDGFIETDYCPEDWEGLREYVASSELKHRAEILEIIDDPRFEPDPKEWRLKSMYPEDYRFLLNTVYPGLRRSDYTIEYTIRHYSEPAEISEIMSTAPQKLSLNEFFTLAQSLEAGSDEYNEVFETAVRMFPGDETANLNAANSAMQRGDLAKAEKYLSKAGESAEATYAQGVLAMLRGDYAGAAELYRRVGALVPEAAEALRRMEELTTLK